MYVEKNLAKLPRLIFHVLLGFPAAKKSNKNMNACTEVIFTAFNGYILAYDCKELGRENIYSDISLPIPRSTSNEQNNCTLMKAPLIGRTITESKDRKYNYTRTLCHFASVALELYDAWNEGYGSRVIRC